VAVVESGCKRIYNDQNQYFLDLTATSCDIGNQTRVVIPSTYLKFEEIWVISLSKLLFKRNFFQLLAMYLCLAALGMQIMVDLICIQ
jgi:hypothetical protein